MKKVVLPISIVVDILSIILIFIYFNLSITTWDKVFFAIYIIFFIVHINDKVRQNKIKKNLSIYKLNRKTDLIYIFSVVIIFILNVYYLYLAYNNQYFINQINIIILFYLICLKTFDVNNIYYDKEKAYYGNRKIDLSGIKKIEEEKKWMTNKFGIYYLNRDPFIVRSIFKNEINELKGFINKNRKKK